MTKKLLCAFDFMFKSTPTSSDNTGSRAISVDPSLGDSDEPSPAQAPPRKKRKGGNSDEVQGGRN